MNRTENDNLKDKVWNLTATWLADKKVCCYGYFGLYVVSLHTLLNRVSVHSHVFNKILVAHLWFTLHHYKATLLHDTDTMFLSTHPPSYSSFSAETQISSDPTDGLLVQASLSKTCLRYLPLMIISYVSNFRLNIVKIVIFVADNSVSMIQCFLFIVITGLLGSLLEGCDVMLINLSILCFYFINNYTNECLDSQLETNPTILFLVLIEQLVVVVNTYSVREGEEDNATSTRDQVRKFLVLILRFL